MSDVQPDYIPEWWDDDLWEDGEIWFDDDGYGEEYEEPCEGDWIEGVDSDCQYGYHRWLIDTGRVSARYFRCPW